jgi:hypothetical protein
MLYFNTNLYEETSTETNRYVSKKAYTTWTCTQQNFQVRLPWSSVRKWLKDWQETFQTKWLEKGRRPNSKDAEDRLNCKLHLIQAQNGKVTKDCAVCSNRVVK